MDWEFQARDASQAASAHSAFVAFIRNMCTSDSDFYGAAIVFTELVANVVRHAPGPIEITLDADTQGSVMLTVRDTGPMFTPAPSLPDLKSESGRGLFLISQFCAGVFVAQTATGKSVSAVLPLTMQRWSESSKRA